MHPAAVVPLPAVLPARGKGPTFANDEMLYEVIRVMSKVFGRVVFVLLLCHGWAGKLGLYTYHRGFFALSGYAY